MYNSTYESDEDNQTSSPTEPPITSDQQQNSSSTHEIWNNTTTLSNDYTNNYSMTPNTSDSIQQSTNDSNNTEKLGDQLDVLIEQLEMERENNTYALDLLEQERTSICTEVTTLRNQIVQIDMPTDNLGLVCEARSRLMESSVCGINPPPSPSGKYGSTVANPVIKYDLNVRLDLLSKFVR